MHLTLYLRAAILVVAVHGRQPDTTSAPAQDFCISNRKTVQTTVTVTIDEHGDVISGYDAEIVHILHPSAGPAIGKVKDLGYNVEVVSSDSVRAVASDVPRNHDGIEKGHHAWSSQTYEHFGIKPHQEPDPGAKVDLNLSKEHGQHDGYNEPSGKVGSPYNDGSNHNAPAPNQHASPPALPRSTYLPFNRPHQPSHGFWANSSSSYRHIASAHQNSNPLSKVHSSHTIQNLGGASTQSVHISSRLERVVFSAHVSGSDVVHSIASERSLRQASASASSPNMLTVPLASSTGTDTRMVSASVQSVSLHRSLSSYPSVASSISIPSSSRAASSAISSVAPPPSPPPECIEDNASGCLDNSDCCESSSVCTMGLCVIVPPPPACIRDNESGCTENSECCELDSVCSSGSCVHVPLPPLCIEDNASGCTDNSECCESTSICDAGICVSLPPPPLCIEDNASGCLESSDCCESSSVCSLGSCVIPIDCPVRNGHFEDISDEDVNITGDQVTESWLAEGPRIFQNTGDGKVARFYGRPNTRTATLSQEITLTPDVAYNLVYSYSVPTGTGFLGTCIMSVALDGAEIDTVYIVAPGQIGPGVTTQRATFTPTASTIPLAFSFNCPTFREDDAIDLVLDNIFITAPGAACQSPPQTLDPETSPPDDEPPACPLTDGSFESIPTSSIDQGSMMVDGWALGPAVVFRSNGGQSVAQTPHGKNFVEMTGDRFNGIVSLSRPLMIQPGISWTLSYRWAIPDVFGIGGSDCRFETYFGGVMIDTIEGLDASSQRLQFLRRSASFTPFSPVGQLVFELHCENFGDGLTDALTFALDDIVLSTGDQQCENPFPPAPPPPTCIEDTLSGCDSDADCCSASPDSGTRCTAGICTLPVCPIPVDGSFEDIPQDLIGVSNTVVNGWIVYDHGTFFSNNRIPISGTPYGRNFLLMTSAPAGYEEGLTTMGRLLRLDTRTEYTLEYAWALPIVQIAGASGPCTLEVVYDSGQYLDSIQLDRFSGRSSFESRRITFTPIREAGYLWFNLNCKDFGSGNSMQAWVDNISLSSTYLSCPSDITAD